MAFAMRSTTGCGVPAGASRPVHELMTNPGKPDSSIVGICGSPGQRLAEATASTLIFPDFTCGMGTSSGSNAMDTSPDTSAGRIGALPL
ncbi:hypothetical protein D3C87_1502220 [compost metagenome]